MPKNAGNRNIKKAFEYFKKRIQNEIVGSNADDAPDEILNRLSAILEKVNTAVIVMIEVSTYTDAYILFESLNNRGTPLTAVDLIKNMLLRQLDIGGDESIDYYFSRWKDALECLGDDYSVQERFFRHNYNAFRRIINLPFAQSGDTRQYQLGTLAKIGRAHV